MRYSFSFIFFVLNFPLFGQISFEEVAQIYNVNHEYEAKTIGGGISFYDFNNDGLDDLTLATEKGRKIAFYKNTGNGFELSLPLVENKETVKQILWVDYDNDGDADLFIAAYQGVNRLYENKGGIKLIDVTQESKLPLEVNSGYGACWGDFNRDGWLDLQCSFRTLEGQNRGMNRLYKNNANGTFTDVTESTGMGNEGRLPFCSAFIDYNNDNWPDLYTANDKLTINTLYKNNGNGAFENVSMVANANLRMNAMCVNPGDVNNDGWIDIYISNTPIGNRFLLNNGASSSYFDIGFDEVATESGVGFYGNAWGTNFLDADNDGDLDLYVSGSIPGTQQVSSLFYENINTQYFDIPEIEGFMEDTVSSFSNAVGDFNNDGQADILVQNNFPYTFHLWENQSVNDNHWIKIHFGRGFEQSGWHWC